MPFFSAVTRPLLACSLISLLASAVQGTTRFVGRPELLSQIGRYRNVGPRQINDQICAQAAPGVNETQIFLDACNQNPQNSIQQCETQLMRYANSSATATCQHFYTLYNACQITYKNSTDSCTKQSQAYMDCSDFTLQAYAYCACFFNMPDDISTCANVELGISESVEVPASISASGTHAPTAPAPLSGPVGPTIAPPATTGPPNSASFIGITSQGGSYVLPSPMAGQTTHTTISSFLTTETAACQTGTGPCYATYQAVRTGYSCDGACTDGGPTGVVCVQRPVVRVMRRDEI